MADWLSNRPKTQSNKLLLDDNIENLNDEGLLSIETIATARSTKNQQEKNAVKSNQDIDWLGEAPTSLRESFNSKVNPPPATNTYANTRNKQDDNLFQAKERASNSMDVNNNKDSSSSTMLTTRLGNVSTSDQRLFNSENVKRPQTGRSGLPTQYYKILRDKEYRKFFEKEKFRENLISSLNEEYSIPVEILDRKSHSLEDNLDYIIVLSGPQFQKVTAAYDAIEILLTIALKKIVFDKTHGFWVCEPESAQLVENCANQMNMICHCQVSKSDGLSIYYFDSLITSLKLLSTNEQILKDFLNKKFSSKTINIPKDLDPSFVNEYHQQIENLYSNRFYRETLLLIQNPECLFLFGLIDSINKFINQYETFKSKYIMIQVKHHLNHQQVEYLLLCYKTELKRLEDEHPGLQLVEKLPDGYLIGPEKVQKRILEELHRLCENVLEKEYSIENHCFALIVEDEEKEILDIGLSKNCLIQIKFESIEKIYSIPKSCLDKSDIEMVPSAMSIDIRLGDLATQSVDMVVVCSTSQYLLMDLLKKAGTQVESEVLNAINNGQITYDGYETSGGDLLCQRLFFLPWTTQKLDDLSLRQSIERFFVTAIEYAVNTGKSSIAFPALGCGELKYDPNIIAEIILEETQRYAGYNLQILIVLLPDKHQHYKAFCLKLSQLRQKTSIYNPIDMSYQHKSVNIMLRGREEKLNQCWRNLENHVNKHLLCVDCDEFPSHTWNQITIDSFYKYSLERQVLPHLDSSDEKLKLSGPTEQVKTVQTEFYRLKSIKAEEARILSLARIAVWIFQIGNNHFEKYSLKLNAQIETAFNNHKEHVSFRNENNEKCKIYFNENVEVCGERRRKVIRKDFHLPAQWSNQSENVLRCLLNENDQEYSIVLNRFNETMNGKYTQIQIERIQNQRWYMAYKAFKQFSKQKDTQKLLFHGCQESSAEMIIHTCFNRSFAGVNGVLYGVGVYFSTNASYSHGYAHQSPTTHRRCMFLAKVIVGKSILGNPSMKVPPPGYDSTTDNNHMVVTYHDDQAYAAYLITYI